MKRLLLFFALVALSLSSVSVSAQERRPIDNRHPMWMIHIDVWNSADPQKIIDLIPADIKPYVVMNLSLSCQYDTETKMYRMPRSAVRTYKSWASVCQLNNMWFTCQPASGGHTHIQDNDLETFEYFFKTYPNFLGWNYAEQFWGFDVANNESSMTTTSRWALFAKLVEMSHKYGGFLTVSWCGGTYHMNTNPIAELKLNKDFMAACQKYPEAILFLYKYTHASSFYNNESVCWGPFVSGLTKNYGVRYDNCGWNDTMAKLLGDNHGKKYPGSAGIGTVMEQTCVNGGAVWDGPELIWTEDFQNLSNTTVDGYTRRNWGTFPNFKGIWLDMWREIIKGNMYVPSREEVVNKTKIVVVNDLGTEYNGYTAWDDLYNGLYLQTDPFNQKKEAQWNYGQWYNNLCYFKSTGRYGAVPIVTGLYDDLAKSIPVQVKRSNYTSRWGTQAKKVADFNEQYPQVSSGDLYVNRYRNQLVTYTPYSYLNSKKTASANVPLQYNTCESMRLVWGKLSSGTVREYADHIDFYLNNYRSDSTAVQTDSIIVYGSTQQPTYASTTHATGATGQSASIVEDYDAENHAYKLAVKHMGPVSLTINCAGEATDRLTDVLPAEALPTPKQPEAFRGPYIIEAENLDYKSISSVSLTHSGWWATDMKDFAGMGYLTTGTNTSGALRHQLKLTEGGEYDICVRYCNSSKAGNIRAAVNGAAQTMAIEKTAKNDWRIARVKATLKSGTNTLLLTNTGGINMIIDQIIYEPSGTEPEQFLVSVREAEHGTVIPSTATAAKGDTVTLAIHPDEGYGVRELRVVNSIYFTQGWYIDVPEGAEEVSFVMPDDNVTIQPAFYDRSAVYVLDFASVLNGSMPEGWRTTDGTDVHEYPNTFGSGSRTFVGFTGYQGKALYWRNTSAEYGRQTAYPLTLEPGQYKLTYAMAAWKGAPQYRARIIGPDNQQLTTSDVYTAAPNANGSTSANLTSAVRRELTFTVTQRGNYVINFLRTSGGYDEYLLLECRVNNMTPSAISDMQAPALRPAGIYTPSGRRIDVPRHGLNIIVDADGTTRKVMVK